jgi:hypothetical protein
MLVKKFENYESQRTELEPNLKELLNASKNLTVKQRKLMITLLKSLK